MSTIKLTSFRHAAVRLEKNGSVVAFDPGGFSDPAVMAGAAAIFITHEHPDHVAPDAVVAALGENPDAQVWAPDSVVEQLVQAGAEEARVHVPADGETIEVAGFAVQPTVTDHAEIHPEIPIITNVAYLVDGAVLHPGDSLSVAPEGLDTLLLPIAAPWSRVAMVIEYLRTVAPKRAVPIHDAILSEDGRGVWDGVVTGKKPDATEFRRLGAGESLSITPSN